MPVKNLMKQIVINSVHEVLRNEKKPDLSENSIDDIIAYVLNRVPPKYITSERGLLHGKLDMRYQFQQKADLLFLIYEALDEILSRRKSAIKKSGRSRPPTLFPHIIGQVLEETTLSIIPDLEITLIYENNPALMTDSDWKNPYKTNRTTKGHYHFWPMYSEKSVGKGSKFTFQIHFNHPKCNKKVIDLELEILPSVNIGITHFIPTVLLEVKEGIDLDFLSSE